MKKFRFTPIHFIIMGIVSFGILAILLRVLGSSILMLLALFLVLAVLSFLLIFQQKSYEINEVEQIQYVNDQAENSLASLLERMPVGVVKVDPASGNVEWFNPYAELILTNEDGEFDVDLLQKITKTPLEGGGSYATIGDTKYSVYLDHASSVFYFFDASSEYEATTELVTTRPVIGIVIVSSQSLLLNLPKNTPCFLVVWGWIVFIFLQITQFWIS